MARPRGHSLWYHYRLDFLLKLKIYALNRNRVASSCPAGKAHLLYSFSLTITKHFEQVCGAGWAAVEQINNETEAADGDDGVDHELMRAKEDEAVFADSLITLVSREYANFLLAIIVGDLNTPPGMRKV